jgi:hypothetical protein
MVLQKKIQNVNNFITLMVSKNVLANFKIVHCFCFINVFLENRAHYFSNRLIDNLQEC